MLFVATLLVLVSSVTECVAQRGGRDYHDYHHRGDGSGVFWLLFGGLVFFLCIFVITAVWGYHRIKARHTGHYEEYGADGSMVRRVTYDDTSTTVDDVPVYSGAAAPRPTARAFVDAARSGTDSEESFDYNI